MPHKTLKTTTTFDAPNREHMFSKLSQSLASNPCADNTRVVKTTFPFVCYFDTAAVVTNFDNPKQLENLVATTENALAIVSACADSDLTSGVELAVIDPTSIPFYADSILFWLGYNTYSGTMPTEIGLMQHIRLLALNSNRISGTIPTEIGLLSQLTYLTLWWNDFEGTIPTQIAQLTLLEQLYVASPAFNGSLPSQFGLLSNLRVLEFGYYSRISPVIPSQYGLLSRLTIFEFDGAIRESNVATTIPSHIGLLTQLSKLIITGTGINGTIPTQLFQLTNLEFLTLSDNKLSGTVSNLFGVLTQLTFLNLGYNSFQGTLPAQLARLTRLAMLSITHNELSGFLPQPMPISLHINHTSQITSTSAANTVTSGLNCDFSGIQNTECYQIPQQPTEHIPESLFVCVVCAGCVVLAILIALAIFVVRHRGNPCIRATSPMFSVLSLMGLKLLVGCVIALAVVVYDNVSNEMRTGACRVGMGAGSVGSACVLGCVVVRNYVIWRILYP
eukprot:c4213_g1_i1.p1 GENE.c4213_g1_i1~~c4213_g1_i1.p1  ORF type:complete len:513 (-),score=111.46 c4213_g1_i1:52-1560(-)